jgi:hypothetical protein
MKVPKVSRWFWLSWAIGFFVLEGLALLNGMHNGDTLTETVRDTVPAWVVFAGLGWAWWHFTQTYVRDEEGEDS